MTVQSATPAVDLQSLLSLVQEASAPARAADLSKRLPRPRKVRAADWTAAIRSVLDQAVAEGKIFAAASGKDGERRYWSRDERHFILAVLDRVAVVPQPLSRLRTAVAREAHGAAASFIEQVIREAVAAGRLFEHPPQRGKTILFAVVPPPPKLRLPRFQGKLKTILGHCRKLLDDAGVSVDQLLDELRANLSSTPGAAAEPVRNESAPAEPQRSADRPAPAPEEELRHLILTAVAHDPVVSVAQLRSEMPAEYRGEIFDRTVLRLADEGKVILSQDVDPSQLTQEQIAQAIRDGVNVLTTISRGTRP